MIHRFRLLRTAALGLWLGALILSAPAASSAQQPDPAPQSMPGPLLTLYAADYDAFTKVPPPPPRFAPSAATFNVTYSGFTTQAQVAFQRAVDIWAAQIDSAVTINVQATWTSLGAGVLGSAGANQLRANFQNAPALNVYFPDALADKLRGVNLSTNPTDFDIIANFNSNFSNWYLGTDGNTPAGQYDLVSVVLHELGHGLGFSGSMTVSGAQGSWGLGVSAVLQFDRFGVNGSSQRLHDTTLFPNPSAALKTQLESNNLYFNGEYAVAAAGGTPPRLYAPTTWQSGSSFSHWNEATYTAGNANSLMTPAIGAAESIHSPGPLTMGLFKDLGWSRDALVIQAFGYNTSQNVEWIQIRNNAAAAVNLSDYAIGDEEQPVGGAGEGMYLLPNTSLAAGSALTLRVRNDGAGWPYGTQPNPTYCLSCSTGYTALTRYSTWNSSGTTDLAAAGDEIILLKTNGGVSDIDGINDDVVIDAACYGTGRNFTDFDVSGVRNSREPLTFSGGACLSTAGVTNGSFRRSAPATDTDTIADFANNPTAVTLGGLSAAATGGSAAPLILAGLGCALACAAALSRRRAVAAR